MKPKYIIVGLRANYESILTSAFPGYLREATEAHRKGFQLSNGKWYAFSSEPLDLLTFNSEADAHQFMPMLCGVNTGWNWPYTILPVYSPI